MAAPAATPAAWKNPFKSGQHNHRGKAPLWNIKSVRLKYSQTFCSLKGETITNFQMNGLSRLVWAHCLVLLGSIMHDEITLTSCLLLLLKFCLLQRRQLVIFRWSEALSEIIAAAAEIISSNLTTAWCTIIPNTFQSSWITHSNTLPWPFNYASLI